MLPYRAVCTYLEDIFMVLMGKKTRQTATNKLQQKHGCYQLILICGLLIGHIPRPSSETGMRLPLTINRNLSLVLCPHATCIFANNIIPHPFQASRLPLMSLTTCQPAARHLIPARQLPTHVACLWSHPGVLLKALIPLVKNSPLKGTTVL